MKICFNARRAVGLTRNGNIFLALALQSCLNSTGTVQRLTISTPVSTATPEGRLAVFDDVWETIQQRYYDSAFNGVDWEGSRLTFRALAAKAKNTREFYEVIRKDAFAVSGTAHTRVYSPEEKFDWWNPRFITSWVSLFSEVEGTPTVIQVEKTSERRVRAFVRVTCCSILTTLPRKNSSIRNCRSQVWHPTRPVASAQWRTRSRVPLEAQSKSRWQSKAGKRKSATLTRFWNQRQLGFSSQRSQQHRDHQDRGVHPVSCTLEFSKSRFHRCCDGAAGIVLDLRGNGGGDAEAMADVVSPFLERRIRTLVSLSRSIRSFVRTAQLSQKALAIDHQLSRFQ